MSSAKNSTHNRFAVVVTERIQHTPDVVGLRLCLPNGGELPSWDAGSHIDVVISGERVRQFSLCGSLADRYSYYIAVQRAADGRGGSAYMTENVQLGDRLTISAPRNNFPLEIGDRHILIAGGIGITPLVPMVHHLEAINRRWELHYGGRERGTMAFADELGQAFGDKVKLVPEAEYGLLDLEAIVAGARANCAIIYACGPEVMLSALAAECVVPPGVEFHSERFSPVHENQADDSEAFEVELAVSGMRLRVPSGQSILEVASAAGVETFSSCEAGTCGSCETMVLSGEIDHRDAVLSVAEQDAQNTMMICVSRARSGLLVLDL